MLEVLDRQTKLTGNQYRIIGAAVLGDFLEFFDYYLIGYVLAFIVGPWQLSFGQSAIILLSSGLGAMCGAVSWGRLADRIGRKKVFIATILNFSLATGVLALTPDHDWIFLSVFRFFVGFGVGGLYSVDLPLVQEFMPASKRGLVGGLVTVFVPLGTMLGAVLGRYLAPSIGWRGLFAVGLLPGLLTLLVRVWVPESPRWLMRMGRAEEARTSLAWALQLAPQTIPLSAMAGLAPAATRFTEIFRYPRSLLVSWLGNIGAQAGEYGITLWAATLLMLLLKIPPAEASFLLIFVSLGGIVGRISFSLLSERIGRRASGGLFGLGAAAMLVTAALLHDAFLGTVSVFWLLLIVAYFFSSGGFAIVGPYAAEVWPSRLRTTGMGSAYGFGGLGKIIGPLGLALIVGSSNLVTPKAAVEAIVPAYVYLAAWFALAGLAYMFIGFETRGRTIESIDEQLEASARGTA